MRQPGAVGGLLSTLPQQHGDPASHSLHETPGREPTPPSPHHPLITCLRLLDLGSRGSPPHPCQSSFILEEDWGINPLQSLKESDPIFPNSSLLKKKNHQTYEKRSPLKKKGHHFSKDSKVFPSSYITSLQKGKRKKDILEKSVV